MTTSLPLDFTAYTGCVNTVCGKWQNKRSGDLGAWPHLHPLVTSRIKRFCVPQQHKKRSADLMVTLKPEKNESTHCGRKMCWCWMIRVRGGAARDDDVFCCRPGASLSLSQLRIIKDASDPFVSSLLTRSTPPLLYPYPLCFSFLTGFRKRVPSESERQAEQRLHKTGFPGFFFKIKA